MKAQAYTLVTKVHRKKSESLGKGGGGGAETGRVRNKFTPANA